MEIDIAKTLAMSEEEQCKYLYGHFKEKYYKTDDWPEWYGICDGLVNNNYPGRTIILEHLAFCLRDEADWETLTKAMQKVYIQWCNISWKKRKFAGETRKHIKYTRFWFQYAQPIHWILAALKAKEQK